MKILILIPHLGSGGAQQVFFDQFNFYSTHFDVKGCVFNWENALESDHVPSILSLNVPGGSNPLTKLYFFFKRVLGLRALKKKYSIDVCISHLEGADYVNILSKGSEKTFCWIHGTKEYDRNIEGLSGWLRKRILIPILYKRTDLLIAVSQGIRTELITTFKLSPDRIKTLVNGFDLNAIHVKGTLKTLIDLKKIASENPVLITHCRLARQKNLDALLHIFALLNKNGAKLFILGDGELREDLLSEAVTIGLKVYSCWENTELGSGYDIYFLGYQNNPYPYLNQATLYLMTSSWEGFPLALCEAMACHVPVIAADCYTGPREIIAPEIKSSGPVLEPYFSGCGILMPLATPETFQTWGNTINKVLENSDLRLRLAVGGVNRVQGFSKDEITKQWLEILK